MHKAMKLLKPCGKKPIFLLTFEGSPIWEWGMHSGKTRSHRKIPPNIYLPPFTSILLNSKKSCLPGSHMKNVTLILDAWRWGRTLGWRLWVRMQDTLCRYMRPPGYNHLLIPTQSRPGELQACPTKSAPAPMPGSASSSENPTSFICEGKAATTLGMLWAEGETEGCVRLGRRWNEQWEKILRTLGQQGLCWWLRLGALSARQWQRT